MRFYNVTVHVSLLAEDEDDAEKKTQELLDNMVNTTTGDREFVDSINASVFKGDTILCDPDSAPDE